MIRDATADDIPALLDMGERFAEAAGLDRIAPVDRNSLEAMFLGLLANQGGVLIIGDGCAAGGLVVPSFWNAQHVTGQELFWWVDEGSRGQGMALLDALEAAAMAKGAQSWAMVCLEAIRPELTGKIYERRGYFSTEHTYMKVF